MNNCAKYFLLLSLYLLFASMSMPGFAQANLEVNTPAITSIKQRMQSRHAELVEYYNSGAIGLTQDGMITVRDANAVSLAKRQQVNSLVSAENQDRNALYREIARANNHPEWESKIRSTFGQRWINLARNGWWYQSGGRWVQK
ncbi:YdbL family protein [Nitrosomonas sp.]|uniref:YdbL family protein n=1 Tax=Nitrosomonas sp. TaxID=42353 RepID=UPI001D57CC6D|nr:YdbL family protein [Nitrosomonas sp.]MCB1949808.1 YdbL family protein [Nitrosomonas sp.]MCP5242864.1 YdbL family protein [Burkholderiales bacterium]MDR4514382.1 YdbL family protein [Nitrosomonas sp.]